MQSDSTSLFGEIPIQSKRCSKCDTIKPVSEFRFCARGRLKLQAWCAECSTAHQRARYSKADRAAHSRRCRFGIEPADYAAMLEAQNGVCAICRNPESKIDFRTHLRHDLSIDHDHETNSVRGLLCNVCNRALGLFRDDPELLRAAIAYLSLHGKS